MDTGGGGGIRTHGTTCASTVFKTVPFDRSGTPPEASVAACSTSRVRGGTMGSPLERPSRSTAPAPRPKHSVLRGCATIAGGCRSCRGGPSRSSSPTWSRRRTSRADSASAMQLCSLIAAACFVRPSPSTAGWRWTRRATGSSPSSSGRAMPCSPQLQPRDHTQSMPGPVTRSCGCGWACTPRSLTSGRRDTPGSG